MNWIAESDSTTFEGGEFGWYALETRTRSSEEVPRQIPPPGTRLSLCRSRCQRIVEYELELV